MRPFTRSLDVRDYEWLELYVRPLRAFQRKMDELPVPYRHGQHEHRMWEYASILRQFVELGIQRRDSLVILDVGSGGSFFPAFLASWYDHSVTLVDSMVGGDITDTTREQNKLLGIYQVLLRTSAEDLSVIPSDSQDVTMCISVIEHVVAEHYLDALRELCRVTKPGGYIFITSDYFETDEQIEQSPWRFAQHTAFKKETVLEIPSIIDVEFVGDTDLDYRGSFVHNYSFCNICLKKRS